MPRSTELSSNGALQAKKILPGLENPNNLAWFCQPGESWQAYEAFGIFRDLGPARTNVKVAECLDKHVNLINRWSSRWKWRDRALAFDQNEEFERLSAMRELRWTLLKDHIEAAAKLRNAAVERLSELGPKEMSIANAIRAIKVAVDVERLSIGASTQNIAQSIERSGQGEAKDSQVQALEELMAHDDEVANAAARLIAAERERSAGRF